MDVDLVEWNNKLELLEGRIREFKYEKKATEGRLGIGVWIEVGEFIQK